jgi:hypothetical protein
MELFGQNTVHASGVRPRKSLRTNCFGRAFYAYIGRKVQGHKVFSEGEGYTYHLYLEIDHCSNMRYTKLYTEANAYFKRNLRDSDTVQVSSQGTPCALVNKI